MTQKTHAELKAIIEQCVMEAFSKLTHAEIIAFLKAMQKYP